MTRSLRRDSLTGFHHVTARGAGRRVIFEDDGDRRRFLKLMRCKLADSQVEIHAWCLMRNHVHLLLRASIEDISNAMQRLETSYAHYFNGRHGHVGPVFQGRFACEPIDTEEHFFATLCYIHQNPMRAGEVKGYRYPWSSYGEYLGKSSEPLCDTAFALDLLGGRKGFERFHESELGLVKVSLGNTHRRLDDAEAERIAKELFGPTYATGIALLPKRQRDAAIRKLKSLNVSVRQIERLTGIGRNTISRA